MTEPLIHSYLHAYLGAGVGPKFKPYFKARPSAMAAADAAGPGPWQVPDLCRAYNWPTNLAGSGVIAIVELDGGWVQSDMDAYFASIGQPTPTVVDISVDGTKNNPNQHLGDPHDPDVEVALDIQVAGAAYFVATGKPATIRVYWASISAPGGIAAAVRAATTDRCDVCSISWGSDEANWQTLSQQLGHDFIQDMENAAIAATNAGMVVFGAAGDNDSSDGGPNPANVDVPSSCPHVIGCGGTSKTATSETVWNNDPGQPDGQGTGGGFSTVFPPQAFQVGASGPGRMVPDVSADADPNTGYWIYVHGGQAGEGGTSAVAPLYAGLFAALGTKLGFITPTLWKNQVCFNDIVDGDNGYYRATRGPDPCSGIGSPIGTQLARLFASGAPPQAATPVAAAAMTAAGQGWTGILALTYVKGELVKVVTSTG